MNILDFIVRFIPPHGRLPALKSCFAVEVYLAENAGGGWSIYPANDPARALLGGDAPTGNFGTYAAAWQRAHDHNCWTVVEAPTLPGFAAIQRRPLAARANPLSPQRHRDQTKSDLHPTSVPPCLYGSTPKF